MACFALLVLTLFFYQPLEHNDFVNYDDTVYVTANPHVAEGITLSSLGWAFTTFTAANWHPVTWISHLIDVQLFGVSPVGHHLTSLLIHCINVILLFLLLHRITGSFWKCALVAALFAWHPLNVESVAWVSERKNVLSTFFWLLTMWIYVSWGRKPALRAYVEMMIAFSLGLMAKPMLVTLPFVLLLFDFWPLRRFSFSGLEDRKTGSPGTDEHIGKAAYTRDDPCAPAEFRAENAIGKKTLRWLMIEKIPLLLLSAASSLATLKVQARGEAMATLQSAPLLLRLENVITSYSLYIYRMIWPARLAAVYPFPTWGPPRGQVVLGILLLVAVTGAAIWQIRRQPYIAVGWFWFLGSLVPVIGLVQVGQQANADRYMYVPLIGLFILIAWGAGDLVQAFPAWRGTVAILFVAALLALAAKTHAQIAYWHDSARLFEHAIAAVDRNYVAHMDLGITLDLAGKPDAALREYDTALAIKPNGLYSTILYNIGLVKLRQGKASEAENYLRQALNYPAHRKYRFLIRQLLGAALEKQGRLAEAEAQYREVIHDFPEMSFAARLNYGLLLSQQLRYSEAVPQYEELLKSGPDSSIYYKLGEAEEKQGHLTQAANAFQNAVKVEPNYIDAQKKLQAILRQLARGETTTIKRNTKVKPR